jgi:hypothetical protein
MLTPGERVAVVVQGRFLGHDGVAVLTDQRLIVTNAREWSPEQAVYASFSGMIVQGWRDGNSATLSVEQGGRVAVLDQIRDQGLAQELATALRSRVV